MIENVLVLSATVYDFADKSTGEIRQGVTVYVSHLDQTSNQNTLGCKPVKYSLSLDSKKMFENQLLPAFAKMAWNFDFNRMKPVPTNFYDFEDIRLGSELNASK